MQQLRSLLLISFCFAASLFAQTDAKLSASTKEDAVISGVVRLKVVFLASGQIGEILVVSGLTEDLTQQAVAAAKNIKFEPAKKNGVAIDITKTVEYTFTSYFDDSSPELKTKAQVTKMPYPKFPKGKGARSITGKITVSLELHPDGKVSVLSVKSDLPKEFEKAAIKAATKIEFYPAIHNNGDKVKQTKDIVYEVIL